MKYIFLTLFCCVTIRAMSQINDPPSFVKGPDQITNAGAGLQIITGWASVLSAGPVDEWGQSLNFVSSTNNNRLFSVLPVIQSNGTLTYSPATDTAGKAIVTIYLRDDGGTANGGVDRSGNESFFISIKPVGTTDEVSTTPNTAITTDVKANDGGSARGTKVKIYMIAINGNAVANPDGTITYTPNTNYTGRDYYSYTLVTSDGVESDEITVSVEIKPVAVADAVTTRVNTPVNIDVKANDGAAAQPLRVMKGSDPANGSVSISTVNRNTSVIYTPNTGFVGADSFTYYLQTGDAVQSMPVVVSITVIKPLGMSTVNTIKIPNLFTPNGDGRNDVFEIRGIGYLTDNELVIINSGGNEVFRQKGYQNTWSGEGLNEGTYYYVLRVKGNTSPEWETLTGWVTLLRTLKK